MNHLKIIFYSKDGKKVTKEEKKRQKYLQESFQSLTSGICNIEEQKGCYIWSFTW